MSSLTLRWKLAAAGLLCYGALAWYFGGDVLAQRKDAEKGKEGRKKLETVYYSESSCANKGCHGGEPPAKWLEGDDGKPLGLLCRCTEADIWNKNDKHADAYNVLTKARGKQMAKLLKYDVTRAPQCLACHAVVIKDDKVLKASKKVGIRVEEGVNCVVCHGAHVEWVANHGLQLLAGKFRPLSRQVKEDEYGMRDLWDPKRRAELCASCHVGNLAEGKFVTHEMYAAGHPPLPPFEVATFSNEMPRHWQYLREKTPAVQKELGLYKGELEETKLVLVGAAITLRETMRLLEADAGRGSAKKDVLDLASFDCYACHHDLTSPSWRQKRGYKGKPGRVPMRPWPTELVALGLEHLAAIDKESARKERARLAAKMKNIIAAFDAGPYGDTALIKTAAADLAGWADGFATRMNEAHPDSKAAGHLLEAIPVLGGKELLDYDSARRLSWALEVIFTETNGEKANPAVRKTLDAIGKQLKLRLPQGRNKLIEDELEESLKKINDYKPETFRSLLRELGKRHKPSE
jgi:hypothetical protein